ncbi:MAG: cytochrome c peroxidase, partial [Phycisphaeraceae bacterium]|nr:cytochrome c peroxidase [Phycisphaeraceae bacterium]
MKCVRNSVWVLAAMVLSGPNLWAGPETQAPEPAQVRKRLAPFFKPRAAPPEKTAPDKRVELGRMLFYERRLSLKKDRSCQDCHDLARHGANGPIITR